MADFLQILNTNFSELQYYTKLKRVKVAVLDTGIDATEGMGNCDCRCVRRRRPQEQMADGANPKDRKRDLGMAPEVGQEAQGRE